MKSLKILIISLVLSAVYCLSFLLISPEGTYANVFPKELSDSHMQNLAIQYLSFILLDMDFLVITKPVSWEAFWEDLKKFEYIEDDPANVPKMINEFHIDRGGDCDEFMLYINARLLQFNSVCGFMSIVRSSGGNHIIAVYKTSINDYVVVDVPLSKELNRDSPSFDPLDYVKYLKNYSYYRVWWFLERVENQPPIQRIK